MITRRLKMNVFMIALAVFMVLLPGCHSVESDVQGPLGNLNHFTAFTRKNDVFTQENFAGSDLTLICFWAPWSDSSVYELKHLVALSEKLPENVAFVSVCLDSSLEDSKARLKELDLKGFITLEKGDGDFKIMCDAIVNVPTAIIVDSQGNLIGGPVIGIQDDYENKYLSVLNDAMKQTGGKKITLKEKEED